MTETEQLFLKILKALVNTQQISLPYDTDLLALFQISKIHSLAAAVGFALNHQLESQEFEDAKTSQNLQQALFQTIIKQTRRLGTFEKLLDRLSAEQIPVILFKGCVVNKYYPDPAIRTFGDIDFLVDIKDRERLDVLMVELGYTKSVQEETVWMYCKGAEIYEVHTSLMPSLTVLEPNVQGFVTSAWENTVPTKRNHIFTLEPNYHFIFLLLHLAKHMRSTGAGVRMYLDLALMYKNEPMLDLEKLKSIAEILGFLDFLGAATSLCERWFGISGFATAKIEPKIMVALEEYVMAAGVFGFHGRNPAVARLRDQQGGTNRFGALCKYVFPAYKDMKTAYSFLNGRPILLPVVWVVRWWDGLFCRRKRAVKIFKGMFTEGEAAQSSELLLQSIGITGRMK